MVVLLHSGGLDSQIAWLMHPEWQPVYVRHGATNETAELGALSNLALADPRFTYEVLAGPLLRPESDGHVQHRNLLLLTTALSAFPATTAVAFGALLGEGSGDKSRAFCRSLERTWQASEGRRVRVLRPLGRMTKSQALRHALTRPGSHTLSLTVSCLHGVPSCGRCQPCFRRGIAEYLNGLREDRPPYPTETKGAWATLRANKLRRWPSLAVANLDVVRARGHAK